MSGILLKRSLDLVGLIAYICVKVRVVGGVL